MIGYSDDARVSDLLAPLRRLEPVALREREGRMWRWRPVLVAALVTAALAGTGIAIAAGFGAFNGITAAQHTKVGASVLPPKLLAQIKQENAENAKFRKESGTSWPPALLPDTARLLGTMPNGSKVYGLTDTRGELCLFGLTGGGCSPPLSHSRPITMEASNSGPIPPGGTLTISGVAIDGVTSVSFDVWRKKVTVSVEHNLYVYVRHHSTALTAHCVVAHFANGAAVHPFPEESCP